MTKKRRRLTTDAVEILHRRYYAGRPQRLVALAEERTNAEIARQICALREKAGLTQQQLARLVGTTASVICRLEDADYAGHSLSMLRRIATAVNMRIEIRFLRGFELSLSPWRLRQSTQSIHYNQHYFRLR